MAHRYELINIIDSGSVADVWRARDRHSGKIVALKRIRDLDDMTALDTLKREVRAAEILQHPMIVPIIDSDLEAKPPYVVMPLYQCNITKLISKIDPTTAQYIVAQLARGLVAIHEKAALHRDLKPDNILVSAEGALAISDFGVGGLPSRRMTTFGSTLGAYDYAAPELLCTPPFPNTAASDVYALGATLFHLLTGVKPLEAIKRPEGLDPARYWEKCPSELRDWLLRMLAQRPEDRPPASAVWQWAESKIHVSAFPLLYKKELTFVASALPLALYDPSGISLVAAGLGVLIYKFGKMIFRSDDAKKIAIWELIDNLSKEVIMKILINIKMSPAGT